jgi:hypothetical protein
MADRDATPTDFGPGTNLLWKAWPKIFEISVCPQNTQRTVFSLFMDFAVHLASACSACSAGSTKPQSMAESVNFAAANHRIRHIVEHLR